LQRPRSAFVVMGVGRCVGVRTTRVSTNRKYDAFAWEDMTRSCLQGGHAALWTPAFLPHEFLMLGCNRFEADETAWKGAVP
jgi:hypothetical protein